MRDIYTESVVPIQPKLVDKLLKAGLAAAAAISLFFALMMGFLWLIPTAVFGYLLYRQIQKTDGEYDYVHTNDVFDVDVVTMGKYRKSRCSVNLNYVILVAPVQSPEMASFANLKGIDYTGNMPESVHAMVYTENGKQKKLLLRLNGEMLKSLKQWLPDRVQL